MTRQPDLPVEPGVVDRRSVDALTEAECRHLLGSRTFGRIGVTSGGLPVILPVRYYYEDDAITFRTGEGSNLRAARNGDVLAFQVDAYDPDTCEGWSVLVLGRASVLAAEDDETAADEPMLDHYVRMGCELVTGRVLTPATPV